MSLFQLFIGFLILISTTLRPILYKPAAKHFPPELSAAFTSSWLIVGLILTFPIFGHLYYDNALKITTSAYLLLAVLKGLLLWFTVKLQQKINKTSTSSSVFFGFISMALGSLINNLFFKEGLALFQVLCICGLGILGLMFVLKGDAKTLSKKGKIDFGIIILVGATFSITDHLAIPQIGWYPYLLFSSLAMFIACLISGISKQDYHNIFLNKSVAFAGIFYTISEFLIIYASINILPVSFVGVFMRMSAPIVMIISALVYKEQSLKNQLTFGALAMLLTLPLIFL